MMRLQHGCELNLALLNPAFPDLGELKNNYVLFFTWFLISCFA